MAMRNVAEWLQANLSDWNGYQESKVNEANTESWVIRPILSQLGWKVNQPGHIFSQFAVGSERIDLALLREDGMPVALIEEKAISIDLDEEVSRGTIDLEKYKRQLSDSQCDILVITNGMKTWFWVRIETRGHAHVRRCESATVDFGDIDPNDSAAIQDAANKLALLDRSELISGATFQRLRESAELELAIERVNRVLNSRPVTDAIAKESGLDSDIARRALEIVIGDGMDEGGMISLPSPKDIQSDGADDQPPQPSLIKLRRKMIDSTSEAKRFRSRAAKFRRIWELFLQEGYVSKNEIDDRLRSIVNSVKARGQFYGAYLGRFGPYLLECVDHDGSGGSGKSYEINDYVRGDIPEMLRLMEEENGNAHE